MMKKVTKWDDEEKAKAAKKKKEREDFENDIMDQTVDSEIAPKDFLKAQEHSPPKILP